MMQALLLIVALAGIGHVFAQQAPLVVNTEYGPIRGSFSSPGARSFKGVPYVAPPVNELRWRDPVPPRPWTTTLAATEFRPSCPQDCFEPPFCCPTIMSEDCLYLNIYTPAYMPTNGTRLPVLVYFHGGNFIVEGPGVLLYDGDLMANATDSVVVTVAYRLGALGFLATDELAGNYGIEDQRAALRWVQRNAHHFGGDAGRVTIFGQSAGGGSVAVHMTTAKSQGLFHRAIFQSNPFAIQWKERPEAITFGDRFAGLANCTRGDKADVACLRSLPADDIVVAQMALYKVSPPFPKPFKHGYVWSPNIDAAGTVPVQPLDAFMKGEFTRVPMIVGSVMEEGIQFVEQMFKKPISAFEHSLIVPVVFGLNNTNAVNKMYPVTAEHQKDTRPVLSVIANDYTFACPSRLVARIAAKLRLPVYMYYFDHALTYDAWGPDFAYCTGHACHGVDVPTLFGSAPLAGYEPTPDEHRLTARMLHFLKQFAWGAHGTLPSPDDTPAWPLYDAAADNAIVFDTPNCYITTRRLNNECDLWDELGYLDF